MPIMGPRSQPASFRDRHRSQLPTPPGTPSKASKEPFGQSALYFVQTQHPEESNAYQSIDGRLSVPAYQDSSPSPLSRHRKFSSLTRAFSRQLNPAGRHSAPSTASSYHLDRPIVVTGSIGYEDIYAAFGVRPPRLPSLSAYNPIRFSVLPVDLNELPNEMLKRYNSHLEATFSGSRRGLPDFSSIQKFERGVREAIVEFFELRTLFPTLGKKDLEELASALIVEAKSRQPHMIENAKRTQKHLKADISKDERQRRSM